MRILAVDPGSQNIGIAISDPTGTIANPLTVIKHISRAANASAIVNLAKAHEAGKIVVGQSLDEDGQPTFEGRRAARLAAELRSQVDIPVLLWDESFSTVEARQAQIKMETARHKRKGHLDDLAATLILQSFLDAQVNTDE
jgi:putative Holliday junction resolvase